MSALNLTDEQIDELAGGTASDLLPTLGKLTGQITTAHQIESVGQQLKHDFTEALRDVRVPEEDR